VNRKQALWTFGFKFVFKLNTSFLCLTGSGLEIPPPECKLPPLTELEEKLIEIINGDMNISGIPTTTRFGAATSLAIQKSPSLPSTKLSVDISQSETITSQNSPDLGLMKIE
jgi:hypothetical protein